MSVDFNITPPPEPVRDCPIGNNNEHDFSVEYGENGQGLMRCRLCSQVKPAPSN